MNSTARLVGTATRAVLTLLGRVAQSRAKGLKPNIHGSVQVKRCAIASERLESESPGRALVLSMRTSMRADLRDMTARYTEEKCFQTKTASIMTRMRKRVE